MSETESKFPWQAVYRHERDRVLKISTSRGHGSGFHIGKYGIGNSLCAVITALHVVGASNEWEEPIKLIQSTTGKEVILHHGQRSIFVYKEDLALIIFHESVFNSQNNFNLSRDPILQVPHGKAVAEGVDIAWLGYPNIKNDMICFFHGYISAHLKDDMCYLVDGVAINGVSGGPAFLVDKVIDKPVLLGVMTAYVANRATGETLPGLSMVTSIQPAEATIKMLTDLPTAIKQAEEQDERAGEESLQA
jgi:hypothetical protein